MAVITKKYWAGVAALVVLAGVLLYIYTPTTEPMPAQQITLDSHALFVEVANTPALREQGLSGHEPLIDGQGMLFIFDQDDAWGIWMKDMRFAIDIVWADASGKVVTVAANATPDSYPQVFYPTAPARYVLEIPAGYTERNGIAEGSQLTL